MGEWMYRCIFSLPLGKEPPVPIGYETGWTPEPVFSQVYVQGWAKDWPSHRDL
jgi:hypothetical protein